MEHLSREQLSALLDGEAIQAAGEHLESCDSCRAELEAMRRLQRELKALPELDPPPELWPAIEARVVGGGSSLRFGLFWPRHPALQAAAMAAVFVLGVVAGRVFDPGGTEIARQASVERPATVTEAMAQVQRTGAAYEAALRNLETLADESGQAVPHVTAERLASLDALVEASRTALSVEPADPVLNAYLFAALDQRADVMRQVAASGSGNRWR